MAELAKPECFETEDEWLESLLADAEKRAVARHSTKTSDADAPSSDAKLAKTTASNALAPQATQSIKDAPKKREELSVRVVGPAKQKAIDDDAGADWFNMPKTNVTPELVRDLKLLRMRNVLNGGKQFFKKDTRSNLVPTYSQVGTIVEGPLDTHNSRLTRKERKRTLAEEVLSSSDAVAKFKTKYNAIQTKKMDGKKGHYKKMMARRYKK